MLKRALLATAGAAAGTALYTWLVEPHWVEFVRRELPLRGLPRDLEGRMLVQMSPIQAMESLVKKLGESKSNAAFLERISLPAR